MVKVKYFIAAALLSVLMVPGVVQATGTPSGQLTFSLRTAGEPIRVSALAEASRYAVFKNNLLNSMNDGAAALALIRQLDTQDNSALLNSISSRVEQAVDPQNKWEEFYDFIGATENEWAIPLMQYTLGNESDDEQIYVTVNRELRDGRPDSEMVSSWTKRMREAMWRLPLFEGISFRGTRLRPDQIARYYVVGQTAQDLAFISTSVNPSTAFKFADPDVNGVPEPEKVSLVFVVIGKTGRPVSNFAHGHAHEQEILFANGTPMTVVAKTPVFQDTALQQTQIILMEEN